MGAAKNLAIGLRLKERRQELGLSLRALAARAGLTAAFLSQVERGQTNISIAALQRVAEALNVPALYFLTDGPRQSPVVRSNARLKLSLPDSDVVYELLTPDLNRKVEIFRATLAPGARKAARRLREPTEECIYVLSGALAVELTTGEYVLQPGDSICFDGMTLKSLSCASAEEAVWIGVITPPVF